ncbi:hypothetical protein MNB_SV-6-1735 [hydrothermal vent metagenome]|uniref:Uncharacterized protein n=1 Tax=hydrothermal vent metagenome TaxID=652676 RepID=A0A1W1BY59_9ZZZZ
MMKKIVFLVLMMTLFSVADSKVLYSLDFTKQKDGDAKAWLKSKGFLFKLDADDLNMVFRNGRLVISTQGETTGLLGIQFTKSSYLYNVGIVKIVWGVNRFPQGADWANGNNRLAIGALISLGTEMLSSGLPMGVKAAPYFFGPFIGEKEKVGGRYLGVLYKEGGRYYCVSTSRGKRVVTNFNIDQKFQEEFKKPTPPVTAFGFQMNTKDTKGGAEAFIESITFYSK